MRAVVLVRTPPRVVTLVKADVRNPGSRGGQFHRTKTGKVAYGKTSSGKPISHPSETVAASKGILGSTSHIRMHQKFPGWSEQDHRDAAAHHDAQGEAHGRSDLGSHHRQAAYAHIVAANFPAPKSDAPAVPDGVKRQVKGHLETLREIHQNQEHHAPDKKHAAAGRRYQFEAWHSQKHGEKVAHANQKLDEFEALAKKKGIDHKAVYRELGHEERPNPQLHPEAAAWGRSS